MSDIDVNSPPFRPPASADMAAQRKYALSGKIMLCAIVVLFAVVVVMLCLHLYARFYFLRRRRRQRHRQGRRTHFFFYVEPTTGPVSTLNSGLDPLILKALPTFSFTKGAGAGNGDEGFLECAVCLSEFEDGEKGRRLPKCGHSFHVDCIDMWFHSHSTCPLCRTAVDGNLLAPAKGQEDTQREIADELTRPSLGESNQEGTRTAPEMCGESRTGPSSSFKSHVVGVSVEIPARSASFSFGGPDGLGPSSPAGQGFKSPTSRLLALRRMLSREKKPAVSPSSSACAGGCELAEMEEGRVEDRTSQTRPQTPS